MSEFVVCCFIVLLFQPNLLNQMGLLLALCKGALKHNSSFFFFFSFCYSDHWDFGVSRQTDSSSCPNLSFNISFPPTLLGLHVLPCLSWS